MSDNDQFPDYDLGPEVLADSAEKVKAVAHPIRGQILDLVLERAATVTELAAALGTPRSSMAYHVDRLVEVGMLRVVRTRKVRAIEERFYGRTGRTIVFTSGTFSDARRSFLDEARAEVVPDTEILATMRHARIPEERAAEFFFEVSRLAEKFTSLPRDGDVVFGFVAAVYPTTLPSLNPGSDLNRADER